MTENRRPAFHNLIRLWTVVFFAAAIILASAVFAYAEDGEASEALTEETILQDEAAEPSVNEPPGDTQQQEEAGSDAGSDNDADLDNDPDAGSDVGEEGEEGTDPGVSDPEGDTADDSAAEEGSDNGETLTGFVTEDGVTRCYNDLGEMLTLCWITDPGTGKHYFALEDGSIAAGRFIVFGSDIYYALDDGVIASGIFSAGGITYYAEPETLALRRRPGWVEEGGSTYYILGSGRAATGFLNTGGTLYYMDGAGRLTTGFYEAEGQLRYSDPETGAVVTRAGWLEVDGENYFVAAGGYLVRNMFISFGNHGFFMGSDGHALRTAEEIKEGYGLIYVLRDETGEIPLGWYTDPLGDRYYQGRTGVLRGDVTMESRKYRFDAETGKLVSMVGIDVSEWQGDIDWNSVASDGIDFAMIRVGGRGGGSGLLYADDNAAENIHGAIAAGLRVGVYFYTQAISVTEAREEARYVLSKISGLDITMPVVIDTEELFGGGRHNYLSPSARTAIVLAFCDEISRAGYTPMVYASASYYEDWWLLDSRLGGILHWVAELYGNPDAHSECSYGGETACWQYSWDGSVKGIKYDVDMNIWYLDVWNPWTPEIS